MRKVRFNFEGLIREGWVIYEGETFGNKYVVIESNKKVAKECIKTGNCLEVEGLGDAHSWFVTPKDIIEELEDEA